MAEYEVYGQDGGGATGGDTGVWQVMVEFSNQGQAKPATLLEFPKRNLTSRDEALEEAERTAMAFRPPDPWSPRGRRVFREGDSFISLVEGATQTFHFRTSIVQYVGDAAD